MKKKEMDVPALGDAAVKTAEFLTKSLEINNMLLYSILYLARYVKSLKDYSSELDEAWDKLLNQIEEAQQPKPAQEKEKTKKQKYIA